MADSTPTAFTGLKNALMVLTLLVLAGLGGLWLALTHLQAFARQPADPSGRSQVFVVSSGSGLNRIASDLHRAGLISSRLKFRLLARWKRQDTRIQAGEYQLAAAMAPRIILQRLVDGRIRLHRMTIPEGFNRVQIVAAVAATGLVDGAAFAAAAADRDLAGRLGVEADSLEGYLFPDTYAFAREATASDIVGAMVRRFWQVFGPAWQKRAADLGMTVHQVVTLASIVEKETGQSDERPLIASVFHNRLKRRMRLETDPTVIYGLPAFDGNLTRKHLATPSPYNTYLNAGLPPGPIASPGAAALEAVLYPAETGYLFFVARNDGTHAFSTNLKAHNRAVRRYQKRR